jgi:hypothetical protein
LAEKPINRASRGRKGTGAETGGGILFDSDGVIGIDCVVGKGMTGSGLRDGELSSLLGGVLNGDTRVACIEGRLASGWRIFVEGVVIDPGLTGILGLSALLTGGGTAFCFSSCTTGFPPSMSTLLCTVGWIGLGALGPGVDARLECCDTNSRTLPNGVLSIRSGDREALRSKYVRGGDRGDSILTDGVS